MLSGIISIVANAVFMFVLNRQIYTDRAMMPEGGFREWKRSPITRLNLAGEQWLFYIQMILSVISVVTGLLIIIGIKHKIVKQIQIISLIAAAVMFVIIMIVTSNSHAKYV